MQWRAGQADGTQRDEVGMGMEAVSEYLTEGRAQIDVKSRSVHSFKVITKERLKWSLERLGVRDKKEVALSSDSGVAAGKVLSFLGHFIQERKDKGMERLR